MDSDDEAGFLTSSSKKQYKSKHVISIELDGGSSSKKS